jgi:flagellar biogenesis protein FliO
MEATQKAPIGWFAAAMAQLFATVREASRHIRVRRAVRSLRVCESVAVGDRRFLLVVQCERRRYLLGAASNSITLLDRLDKQAEPGLEEIVSADAVAWKGLH